MSPSSFGILSKLRKMFGRSNEPVCNNKVSLMNFLLKYYGGKKYLEIGVLTGKTIARVEARLKVGIDPEFKFHLLDENLKRKIDADTVFLEMTSDEFFKINKTKFDVIFIDGLHLYEQAMKDTLNALNFLNKRGIIVLHDCNPRSEISGNRKRLAPGWSGDVWKVLYDLRENYSNSIRYFTLDIETGLGIVLKNTHSEFEVKYRKEYLKLPYSILEKDRKDILHLVDVKHFKTFFNKLNIDSI